MRRGGYDLGRMIIYFFVTIIIISLVFGLMLAVFTNYQKATSRCIDNMEDLLAVQELYTSQNCFVYTDDEIDRTYPGVIDLARWYYRDEILTSGSCLKYFDRDVKVSIDGLGTNNTVDNAIKFKKHILTYDGIVYEPAEMIIEIERGNYC